MRYKEKQFLTKEALLDNIEPLYWKKKSQFPVYVPLSDGHDNSATHDNEICYARFPHPNPLPQAGEGANVSLREFHVNALRLGHALPLERLGYC